MVKDSLMEFYHRRFPLHFLIVLLFLFENNQLTYDPKFDNFPIFFPNNLSFCLQ